MTSAANERREARGWNERVVIGITCALVFLAYAWVVQNVKYPPSFSPRGYYPLLADAFQAGQLHLTKEVPVGLAQLKNPYDPSSSAPFRGWDGVHDMSYYRGKLYLYFGVTPAIVLFWPYAILTGGSFSHEAAVGVFCALGFAASAWLFCDLRRRYFPGVGLGTTAAGVLALGFAAGTPFVLMRPDVYEVAISCGYAMMMVSLAATWRALVDGSRRTLWLIVASIAYGLAVGARPSLLFGAIILLVPVVAEWRERPQSAGGRRRWNALMAAGAPITLIGMGLLLYNYLRFDDPFQFGQRYQIGGSDPHAALHIFSPNFFWFNFRVYFLEPIQWTSRFPFVLGIRPPPMPPGYFGAENPFGVLTNLPFVWFALAAPLAWRNRPDQERSALQGWLVMVLLLFATCALTLCLFGGACTRYELEFLPALVLVAILGVLAIERTLAQQPKMRIYARCVWGPLLVASIVFNSLVSFGPAGAYPSRQNNVGYMLLELNQRAEAIAHFRRAVFFNPDFAEAQCNWGTALFEANQLPEAIVHFAEAVRINPNFPMARNNLGYALMKAGRWAEAKTHFEHVVRLRPDFMDAKDNLRRVDALLQSTATSLPPPQ